MICCIVSYLLQCSISHFAELASVQCLQGEQEQREGEKEMLEAILRP